MYTQCPECLTIYKIAAEPLAVARGAVRCGSCNAAFDALQTLCDLLPSETISSLPTHPFNPSFSPPQLTMPAMRPQVAQRELFDHHDTTLRAQRESPAFSYVKAPPRAPSNWGWRTANILFFVGVMAQLGYANRDQLLAVPELRKAAVLTCDYLGCALPSSKDSGSWAIAARDVRPHPSAPDAMIISTTLINQAPFAQPYPIVQIVLSNLDEQKVAMRRFFPEEYVSDAHSLQSGVAPGAATAISFEVADPGNDAVAFEFKFL